MNSSAAWIEHLQLQPHPEGGWFRETYRSAEMTGGVYLPGHHGGVRNLATAIYFLLTSESFSALHRIKSDEIWHFYAGSALTVHVITPEGDYRPFRVGSGLANGEQFQGVVPAGCWFGATVDAENGYALVGCTVSPGFDFADFELAEYEELVEIYPQHRPLVERLTR